jgi:hypothetical protein
VNGTQQGLGLFYSSLLSGQNFIPQFDAEFCALSRLEKSKKKGHSHMYLIPPPPKKLISKGGIRLLPSRFDMLVVLSFYA